MYYATRRAPGRSFGGNSRPRFGGYGGGSGRRFGGYGGRGRGRGPQAGSIHDYIRRATAPSTAPLVANTPIAQLMGFDSLNLPAKVMTNIQKQNYTVLTPIQSLGIPAVREGKDVIGIANTGTGKTAAFLIPLVENILKDRMYKALIVAPTRELALQIRDELRKFADGMSIYSTLIIGKASMRSQIISLRYNPPVVIGTPGRIKDLIERKILKLDTFKMVVLDEADQMLDMGFINDVKYIISFLPEKRQSLFFSATVSSAISQLIQSFVKNPVTVSVKITETLEHIKQDIVQCESSFGKVDKLKELLKSDGFSKVLVFGRTKMGVERLSRDLFSQGFKVASIHGDKPQFQRQQALRMFKEDVVNILIATDVAARGLDIPNVSHVINYDVPQTYEDYIHRIGRTGRANKSGVALTFVA